MPRAGPKKTQRSIFALPRLTNPREHPAPLGCAFMSPPARGSFAAVGPDAGTADEANDHPTTS